MKGYEKMTKANLIGLLKSLEANASAKLDPDHLQRVVNELQVHQIELEIQNRDLREAQGEIEVSRDKYADLYDFSPLGYVTLDEKGIIREINLTAVAMLGHHRAAHIGIPFVNYVDRADTKNFLTYLRRCRVSDNAVTTELRLLRKGALAFDVELHALPARRPGKDGQSYRVAMADISQRRCLEKELRVANTVSRHGGEAIVVCDNRDYILSVNHAFTEITGYSPKEAIGKHIDVIGRYTKVTDGESGRSREYTDWRAAVLEAGAARSEIQARRRNGERYLQQLTVAGVRDELGYTTHFVYIFSDLSQRSANRRTQELTHYDTLTKLPTQALLHERLRLMLSAAERQRRSIALLSIDIDGFNRINEVCGYDAGDQLLQYVSARLAETLGPDGTVSRLSGDHFIVALPDVTGTRQLVQIVEKLQQSVSRPCTVQGKDVAVTLGIGISVFPDDGRDIRTLLRHAEIARHRAKRRGPNQYDFFARFLSADASRQQSLERELRLALEHEQFTLDYQPEVETSTHRIVGCEALLRWRHPERGWVAPENFIAAAEESNLIHDIGAWILQSVCKQIGVWRDAGLTVVPVAVNVSALQLYPGDFAKMVEKTLRQHGIEPGQLVFEVTEGPLLRNTESITSRIVRLREMGVGITLDDYGTHRSSLGSFRSFPIDKIKIDRSLVRGIPADKQDLALVRTMIGIGMSLGIKTVAGGVETRAQYERLSLEGCDEMQGFYLAAPAAANEFARLLRAGTVTSLQP